MSSSLSSNSAIPVAAFPTVGQATYGLDPCAGNSPASVISQPSTDSPFLPSSRHARSNSYTSVNVYPISSPSPRRKSVNFVGSPLDPMSTSYVPNHPYYLNDPSVPIPVAVTMRPQPPTPLMPVVQPLQPIQTVQPINQTVQSIQTVQPINQTVQPMNQTMQPMNQTMQPMNQTMQPINQVQPMNQTVQPVNRTMQSVYPVMSSQSVAFAQPAQVVQSVRPIHSTPLMQTMQSVHPVQAIQAVQTAQPIQPNSVMQSIYAGQPVLTASTVSTVSSVSQSPNSMLSATATPLNAMGVTSVSPLGQTTVETVKLNIVCPDIDSLDLSRIPPYEKIKFGMKDLVHSYKPEL